MPITLFICTAAQLTQVQAGAHAEARSRSTREEAKERRPEIDDALTWYMLCPCAASNAA